MFVTITRKMKGAVQAKFIGTAWQTYSKGIKHGEYVPKHCNSAVITYRIYILFAQIILFLT